MTKNIKYNLHDKVSIIWCDKNLRITEISIAIKWVEYKLWEEWTNTYTWYEDYQIEYRKPNIWFNLK